MQSPLFLAPMSQRKVPLKKINLFPQNVFLGIMNEFEPISLVLRRLRKYNCKNRGWVVPKFSRRERDIPEYFQTHHTSSSWSGFANPGRIVSKIGSISSDTTPQARADSMVGLIV